MFKSFKNRLNDLKFKLKITMSDPIYKIYSEKITHGRQPLYPFTYKKMFLKNSLLTEITLIKFNFGSFNLRW